MGFPVEHRIVRNTFRKNKIVMRRVLTVGVFDMLHVGHFLLFKHAREL